MGKIANLARGLARRQNVPVPSSTSGGWQRYYPLSRERDYTHDVGDGSGSNLVGPGIRFITNGFLEAPIQNSKMIDGDWVVQQDDPMVAFLKRPNPFYSGKLLFMPTIRNWIADGNGYWIIKEFSAAGRPVEMYFVPSWLLEPKGARDGSTYLTHYEYRPNGQLINLDPEQVVHLRYGLDPHNPLKGMSPLKEVIREIYSDEEAARYTASLLRNRGVPGLMISPKGELTVSFEEATAARLDLEQKTTGDQRGKTIVMTSATDVQEFGFSPEQMDLADIRAIPETRVAAALEIQPAVLGFLSGLANTKVGATMAEMREQAWESGIIPKMGLVADEVQTQFLPHYVDDIDQYNTAFDITQVRVLQEDKNKLHERLRQDVTAGVRTVASFKLGVGEVPEPGDDVYLRSFSVTEVGPDAVPLPAPTPLRVVASRSLAKRPTKEQIAYLRTADRSAGRLSALFGEELRAAFDDLGQRAAAAYDSHRSEFPMAASRFVADPVDDPLVTAILSLLDLELYRTRTLEPLWGRHYQRAASLTYEAMKGHLAVDVGTDLPDVIARQVVLSGGRQLGLIDLDAQTRSALFEALAAARTEGLGPVESSRRIRQYVGAGRYTSMEQERAGSGIRYRAESIARTETLHAQRVSVAEVGRAAGFTQYLAFDNRTGFDDPECASRDGQMFSYEEMLAETAAEHPNGSLSFAPVPGSQAA